MLEECLRKEPAQRPASAAQVGDSLRRIRGGGARGASTVPVSQAIRAIAVLPGADHMGMIATTVLGIVGSLIGGLIGSFIWKPAPDAKFHPAGFVMSIVGAIVVLLALRFVR